MVTYIQAIKHIVEKIRRLTELQFQWSIIMTRVIFKNTLGSTTVNEQLIDTSVEAHAIASFAFKFEVHIC